MDISRNPRAIFKNGIPYPAKDARHHEKKAIALREIAQNTTTSGNARRRHRRRSGAIRNAKPNWVDDALFRSS
jgi:hypothetical protein